MRTANTDPMGDARADPSLRWAYGSLYRFCHAQAQMNVISVLNISSFSYKRVVLTFGVLPITSETFYQREIYYLHYSDGSDQPILE